MSDETQKIGTALVIGPSTKSACSYVQVLGRKTRPTPGASDMSDTQECSKEELETAYAEAQASLYRLDRWLNGRWHPFKDRLSLSGAQYIQSALGRSGITTRICPSAITGATPQ